MIVNTKAAAESLYKLYRIRGDTAEACHLSTNMCPAHRMTILDFVGKRIGKKGNRPEEPGPLLCISTQLIEAGVDVDFGAVIRFAAGLDSVAQAAGRCNRNGRNDRGLVSIVNPADEDLRYLDDIRVGREATIRILDEFAKAPEACDGDLLGPTAIERYFRYYFFDRRHLMDYPVSIGRDDTLLNLLSENTSALSEFARRNDKAPPFYWRQSFMTAADAFKVIDAPTQGVVVPYGNEGQRLIGAMCAASGVAELASLLRQAQRYSVNVFPWVLDRLRAVGAVHEVQKGAGVLYLDSRYYSEEIGLSATPVGEQPFLNV